MAEEMIVKGATMKRCSYCDGAISPGDDVSAPDLIGVVHYSKITCAENLKAEMDSALFQVEGLRKIAEDAMAAYRYECYLEGKEPNESLEARFQDVVRGAVEKRGCLACSGTGKLKVNGGLGYVACDECAEKRVEAAQKVEHCKSPFCVGDDKCHCQCYACLQIVNF